MQITAKLIQTLPLQTGQGKNGEWKKQDIIVETKVLMVISCYCDFQKKMPNSLYISKNRDKV